MGRVSRLIALVVAVAAGGVLIWLDPPPPPRSTPTPVAGPAAIVAPKLVDVWPSARVAGSPGKLADGSAYTPAFYLDPDVSIGTAATPDGAADRLLLRDATGTPRELRRVPKDRYPQFLGFTASGDHAYWVESTATAAGAAETRIWRVNWRTGAKPVSLTADTGDVMFFNSQYDLVVADGRVHWIAAAPTESPVTEVRSVPVAGGRVTTRRITGAYGLSAWPWITTAPGSDQPLELVNLRDNARVRVPTAATEMVGCSPTWCRALIGAQSGGTTRFDLMRPDGTDRHRVAGAEASASVSDVALLDRFEVLSQGRESGAPEKVQLLLYDATTRKMTLVAEGAGIVQARGWMLWWSTGASPSGGEDVGEWHALDLRTI